ncbi:hypothetical protein GW17_00016680 [Ensete ventricosum]|nr:hypothetical protein GW17_00016680 [Ensete ventricosum]
MWYNRLRPSSVSSFDQFAREYELNFLSSTRPKPSVAMPLGLSQKDDDPFSHFIARLTIEIRGVPDAHPLLVMQAFMMGLRSSRFLWLLVERSSATIPTMLQRADQYIIIMVLVARRHEESNKRPRTE